MTYRPKLQNLRNPVLVTGASGFVGANLCLSLLERGASVIGVGGVSGRDWRLESIESLKNPSFRRVSVDLRSKEQTLQLLRETSPSVIINCAAYGAYSNQTEKDRIYSVNFDAVRSLLDGARELKDFVAFIQAGSSSEYGTNCTAPLEDAPTIPDSDYAVSKVAATAAIRFYATKFGLPAWSFRLYSVYGPFEDASRLIPKLLLHARDGKLPPLVNPKISRDFIYVEDVTDACVQLIEGAQKKTVRPGEVYNIGSGTKTTLEDLVSATRKTFSVREEPRWGSMPERHWDHPDWFANPSKAKKEFGWSAGTPLVDGLKETYDWLTRNPEMVQQSLDNSVLQAERARA
jgi:nucleoside-diphosphate-sugar epimerase